MHVIPEQDFKEHGPRNKVQTHNSPHSLVPAHFPARVFYTFASLNTLLNCLKLT